MGKVLRVLSGFLMGAAVGGILALLYAPGSGEATREQLQGYVEQILDEGRQAAEGRRLELTAQLEAMTQPGAKA